MKDLFGIFWNMQAIFFKNYVAYKSLLMNHVLWMYTMSFCFMTLLSWRPYRSANNVSSLKIHITYLHSTYNIYSVPPSFSQKQWEKYQNIQIICVIHLVECRLHVCWKKWEFFENFQFEFHLGKQMASSIYCNSPTVLLSGAK